MFGVSFLSHFNLSDGEEDGVENAGVTPALIEVLLMDTYSHSCCGCSMNSALTFWNFAIFFLVAA